MTAVLQRSGMVSPRRVITQLARFEARRLWRNPALIGGVLITVGALYQNSDLSRAPVLNRLSFLLAWPMLLMAGGVYLTLGTAASRRHGVDNLEGLDALPTDSATNNLGIGLAFISPVLVGIALQLSFVVPRLFDSPVASIVWSELLAGPATVALGATAGLAVGWGFRWQWTLPIVGLIAVAAVTTAWWAESGYLLGRYTPWLSPVADSSSNQYAFEQMYRPSVSHLTYVVLLAGGLGALAAIRGRSLRGKVIASTLAGGLLVLSALAGSAQLQEPTPAEEATRRAAYIPTSGDYVCQKRGLVTYCAYRTYVPWIEEWAAQIEPVLALVPSEASDRPLEVRQQVSYFVDEDVLPQEGDIRTGLWWSREPLDQMDIAHPLNLSLAAAGWAVGLPTHEQLVVTSMDGEELVVEKVDDPSSVSPDGNVRYQGCSSHGQARAVAALWYASQASVESIQGLRFQVSPERYQGVSPNENLGIDIGYLQPSSSVAYFRRETHVALAMAELPPSQVAGTLARRWSEVTNRATTTEEIADWFGVRIPAMTTPDDSWMLPCH
ncbi:MAG: hypothetical protein WD651_15510 [Acidimicrobiia bacterium]